METGSDPKRVAVIIEDDADIRNLLATVLREAGFETVTTANGLDGIQAVREFDPVVTTLDINMPGIDGLETAKRLRTFSTTYIIMLTARDDEIDTLQGLDAGADDYLTKPFRPRELRARVEAMLRRPRQRVTPGTPDLASSAQSVHQAEMAYAPGAQASVRSAIGEDGRPASAEVTPSFDRANGWMAHNGLRLNPEMRIVINDSGELELTRSEFDLLAALMESKRRVRSKADLALLLRGANYVTTSFVGDADKRAIEVHMANLRRKLGDSITAPRWIETVRGVGYRLAASDNR